MNEIDRIKKCSVIASRVYLFLLRMEGSRCFTAAEIAEQLCMSRGSVENAKRELRSLGLVETETIGHSTSFYLPYDVPIDHVNVLPVMNVRQPLDPPLESVLEVKSEAEVVSVPLAMGKGAHVGRVLHAYRDAFPGKPVPSPSQIQQWITAITVDPLVDMIDRMAGKDIGSPVGYVASAVKREALKRQEQGAPDNTELEEERARGIALARLGARQHGEEAVQQPSVSERRARKNSQSS